MPIELWIVVALVGLGLVGVAALRLRRPRRTQAEDTARNIYTLW
jgi:hypothetical protein